MRFSHPFQGTFQISLTILFTIGLELYLVLEAAFPHIH